ncbi:fimbria/pilus outer membrane usher protein [Vibrio alginolyticus]|uniref:fimbria/pilus outer membrane usher protein n=1 Tax=Vibrio alginolyticus TaxID=663 RepID=UPI00215FD605|nr:fimbria/pilus outer membrane usher protein [Vibrio alginolyticus]MCS0217021.1 fimbrial biogenesis outer membrane usher protein [Vibrio alginolyticus]
MSKHVLPNLLMIIYISSFSTIANDYNTELLMGIDVDNLPLYLEDDSSVNNGYYDIYVNSDYIISDYISFERGFPCISHDSLTNMNLKEELLNKIRDVNFYNKSECYVIPNDIVDYNIDSNYLRVKFNIAQVNLSNKPRGYVNPSDYNFGDNGAYLNYSANKYLYTDSKGSNTREHLSIDSSLNVNGWYLRHMGYYSDDRYINNQIYLTHTLPDLKSAVKVGRYSTSGRTFNSVPIEGLALEKNTEMLPVGAQGFAPTIRGTASTTAVVKVEQNELEIYRETVPPGDFIIDDLNPLGFGSDLIVTIEESDGSKKKFRVVYNPTSRMIRPGQLNQNVYFGKTNISANDMTFMEYGAEFGLSNVATLYGGVQAASDYNAQLIGLSFGTVLGGISFDITNSNAYFERWLNGQTYNLNWSKSIESSNTDITFAAFRYSTENYFVLSEYVRALAETETNFSRTKGSLALSINQRLGDDFGSLYANVSQRNFWDTDRVERQYQLGYSNFWNTINYSVSANRTEQTGGIYDTSFQLSVNFPLAFGSNNHSSPTVSLAYQGNDHSHNERLGINGVYGEDSRMSYGLSTQRSNTQKNMSLNSYVSYRSPYADMNVNYSHNDNQDSYSFGVRGSVVAWSDGVAFSSQQSDTYAIASIKDVSGAIINDSAHQVTDMFGNAIVGGVYPYRRNNIVVNDKNIDNNILITNGSKSLVPVRGSVSVIKFDYEYKYNVLLEIESDNIIPFATPVFDKLNQVVGYVGQKNRALVNLDSDKGTLNIKTKEGCIFNYNINNDTEKLKVVCD